MSYTPPTADPSTLYFQPPSPYVALTADPSILYFESAASPPPPQYRFFLVM